MPPRPPATPTTERSGRLRRRFKGAILGLTTLAVAAMVGGTKIGRYGVTWAWDRTKWQARAVVGLPPDRGDVEREWRQQRELGAERTAKTYSDFFERTCPPAWRRILGAAGMAPADALFCPANYDWTVVLSSQVFEADATGRAYRMRPSTRSFWTRNHALPGGLNSFFFLPDTAQVRAALEEAHEAIMPESVQTTNSWGCRGPEPALDAPVRGLVIGDSFMQGLFVADDRTPSECLARDLREVWSVPVSILNTGHIGYSPEQYFQTLVEYFDRFRPHFVVLSVCPNDFGAAQAVLQGRGDWVEGGYWLDQIAQFCRTKAVPCLLVPVPFEIQVAGPTNQGHYPGPVGHLFGATAPLYLNPVEAFKDENLRALRDAAARGRRPSTSPLFNGHLDDGHFSTRGAELWGRLVAHRLALILDPPPPPRP